MPGPLRLGLHQLLCSLHLDTHAKARLTTQNEFIIPLAFDAKSFNLFKPIDEGDPTSTIKSTIPSIEESVSIRPKIDIDELK